MVRPDRARYRRYFVVRAVFLVAVVGAFWFGAYWSARTGEGDPQAEAMTVALVFGGLIFAVLSPVSLRWRWQTYLDPNPALVLATDRFRIRHKGMDLWVPWTDVESVRLTLMVRPGFTLEFLEFNLRPEARHKLPPQKAPLEERLMAFRTDDLVYSRPCDEPRIEQVHQIADRLHDQATGGHRLRAAQRAHWPEHLRE